MKDEISIPDLTQIQLLVYQHVVQLTLIDFPVYQAFGIAHRVAALAFNEKFTREGLAAASISPATGPDEATAKESEPADAPKTQP